MRSKYIILALLSMLAFTSCEDDYGYFGGYEKTDTNTKTENANKNTTTAGLPSVVSKALGRLEFPKVKGGSTVVIVHEADGDVNFSTEWDTEAHAQRWSCYTLNTTNKQSNASRYSGDPQYPFDEDIKALYGLTDFSEDPIRSSGFDHGHIVQSAERLYSSTANRQTFYLTNMHPQYSNFNQKGVWYQMEQQVRNLAPTTDKDTLFVVKGGTIDSGNVLKYIKNSSSSATAKEGYIPVPKYFFVAILKKSYDSKSASYSYHAFGYWMEHKNEAFNANTDQLSNYVVNIDDLEEKTGIDFFCNLPDDIENEAESATVSNIKNFWGFK